MKRQLRQGFVSDESGAITALMVFFVLIVFVVGGVGVDYSFAQKSRTELQGAADAAAHAALYARQDNSVETARAAAVDIAGNVLPSNGFGDVVDAADVTFGTWDEDEEVFVIDQNSKDAVLVVAKRTVADGNPIPTFFMGFVGKETWDMQVGSVFRTYLPTCLREGFAANDIVDVRSNNSFTNGFCLHSNTHVSVNSNNYFAGGTVVSMPDKSNVDLPASGYESNEGLRAALRDKKYNIRIVNRIDDIETAILSGDPEYLPDYITHLSTVTLRSDTIDGMESDATEEQTGGGNAPTLLETGRIYVKYCSGGKTLTFSSDITISGVVIITDCKVKFGQGVVLEDVLLLTTNISSKSISAASGLQIGRDDNCATGGGAQIVTAGSVDIPADLRLYGGQIIAKGDINFAANANGIEGASLIAGGKVSGTSNMTMGFCGSGMEDNLSVPYFQLAI